MKKKIFSLLLTSMISLVISTAASATSVINSPPAKEPSASRKAVIIEYESWFETLKLKGPSVSSEISALFYGLGILYDYSSYTGDWGYGANIGVAQGFGGAGNSISSATYAQTRVPWQAVRGGARGFRRFGQRFELGSSVALFYKSITWPTNASGNAPVNTTNPSSGLFLEMRWRLNRKWELSQAAGVFNLNSSMAWRLGLGYDF